MLEWGGGGVDRVQGREWIAARTERGGAGRHHDDSGKQGVGERGR